MKKLERKKESEKKKKKKKMETPIKDRLVAAVETISERLSAHDKNRDEVQCRITDACKKLSQKILEAEERAYNELKELFTAEDERLQKLLCEINTAISENWGSNGDADCTAPENKEGLEKLIARANAELIIEQSYAFCTQEAVDSLDLTPMITFRTDTNVSLRPPSNVHVTKKKAAENDEQDTAVTFEGLNEAEFAALEAKSLTEYVKYRISLIGANEEVAYEQVSDGKISNELVQSISLELGGQLRACSDYGVRVRGEYKKDQCEGTSNWGTSQDTLHVPKFEEVCGWKACPDSVNENKRYVVSGPFGRVATKTGEDADYSTIIGSVALPAGKTTTWKVQVVNVKGNGSARCMYFGVAPYSIDQNEGSTNLYYRGWHFRCHDSVLYSGQPHKYLDKKYGPRRRGGEYVRKGDVVTISFDAVNGNLSFVIKGQNFGNAYEGIPLDKPLVPSSLVFYQNDSIKLLF